MNSYKTMFIMINAPNPLPKRNKRNNILCVCISESVTGLSSLTKTGIRYPSKREVTVEKE